MAVPTHPTASSANAAERTHGQQVDVDPGRRVVVAFNSAWPTAYFGEALAARAALILAIRKATHSEMQGK